jgi:hypothetical protein
MSATVDQFRDRVRDLKTLLQLIGRLERMMIRQRATSRTASVTPESVAVLKASVFIVAYNLVESTIRSAFEGLYLQMHQDDMAYSALREEIRSIWVDQQVRGEIDSYSASPRTYHEKVQTLVEAVSNNAVLEFKSAHLPVSGNLDAASIRRVCEKHGISDSMPAKVKGGQDLTLVKTQRNNLAHGRTSFSECGRDYSIGDLRRIAKQCEAYVGYILRNIEKYATARRYTVGA